MANDSPIGKRLREARARLGMAQVELGRRAGFDQESASPRMNHYEQGKHAPPYQTARKLAAVLGVPTPYLFADDDVLAELILELGRMAPDARKDLLKDLKGRPGS